MFQYVLICSNVNSLAALLHMTSPPDLRSCVQNSWAQYRLKMRKLISFLPVLVQHFHPARRTATSGNKSRLERSAPWLPEAADRASWTHETQTDKDRTFRPFRTNDSQFPLSSVGSSMFQVAAKGQPPEGTQAKPARSRHGGSWNAGFDPAAKEPKSMQGRNAKTTKTTTKVQKAAKGCKRHKIAIWKKFRPLTVLTCRRWSWVHALAHSSQPSMEFTTYDCHAMAAYFFNPPLRATCRAHADETPIVDKALLGTARQFLRKSQRQTKLKSLKLAVTEQFATSEFILSKWSTVLFTVAFFFNLEIFQFLMVVFLHFQSAFCQIPEPSSFQLWPPWEFDSSPFRHVPNLKAKSRKLRSPQNQPWKKHRTAVWDANFRAPENKKQKQH